MIQILNKEVSKVIFNNIIKLAIYIENQNFISI